MVRFHKQNTSVDAYKSKLIGKYPLFKIAENVVNKEYFNGNIYYLCYIDVENERLIGGNKQQFNQLGV